MKKNKAAHLLNSLLIGRDYGPAWELPSLLHRAGFNVDAISSSSILICSQFIRNCEVIARNQSLIPTIAKHLHNRYDWIIITDDYTLQEVRQSELSLQDKLKVLPVLGEENFTHLFSKIGLSKILQEHGIQTPPFLIAKNFDQAMSLACELGFPVFVKKDSSHSGVNVFECQTLSDLHSIPEKIFLSPILIQKKIFGTELDLSAIYFDRELIHFNHSKPIKYTHQFGPSSIRTYRSLSTIEEGIFQELRAIGLALGIHGFTNISCIECNDIRYYFEVDVRPNVWVSMTCHLGEDPALRIKNWFLKKEILSYPVQASLNFPATIQIPYFARLSMRELLLNRYHMWRFIPKMDLPMIIKVLSKHFLEGKFKKLSKKFIPRKWRDCFHRYKKSICKKK